MASDAISAAWSAIEKHLRDNFTAAPIAWPGVNFSPPNGPWVRPTPLWGDGHEATMESRAVVGVLSVTVFGKPGTGYGVIRGHALTIRDLYNGAKIGPARFDTASGPRIVATDPAWLQLVVSIPFTVDGA